jgi:hypothetical protein
MTSTELRSAIDGVVAGAGQPLGSPRPAERGASAGLPGLDDLAATYELTSSTAGSGRSGAAVA